MGILSRSWESVEHLWESSHGLPLAIKVRLTPLAKYVLWISLALWTRCASLHDGVGTREHAWSHDLSGDCLPNGAREPLGVRESHDLPMVTCSLGLGAGFWVRNTNKLNSLSNLQVIGPPATHFYTVHYILKRLLLLPPPPTTGSFPPCQTSHVLRLMAPIGPSIPSTSALQCVPPTTGTTLTVPSLVPPPKTLMPPQKMKRRPLHCGKKMTRLLIISFNNASLTPLSWG